MPRARKERTVVAIITKPGFVPTDRDFVMARLAAARASAQAAVDAVDEMLGMFVEPDGEGIAEHEEAVEAALHHLGCATRAMECAEVALPSVDFKEMEPWEED